MIKLFSRNQSLSDCYQIRLLEKKTLKRTCNERISKYWFAILYVVWNNLRVLCSVYCSFAAADDDIANNCLDSDISGLNAEFDDI